MALAGYAAEASLYRTGRSYVGRNRPTGNAGAMVVPQLDCGAGCALKWQVCNIGCVSSGPFLPLCLAACGGALALCLNGCPSGGGGGGGGSGGNRVCCERDPSGRCRIFKPPGGQCP
jgi:hypothetical protein